MFAFSDPVDAAAALAEAQRQHDLMHMKHDEIRHRIYRQLDGLDRDGLEVVRSLLRTIAIVPESAVRTASMYEGYAVSRLQVQDNVCPACGTNHDETLEDALHGTEVDEP